MAERKIYRKLVAVDDVLPTIEKYVPLEPLGEVEASLQEAVGRVLSRNVYAPTNYPPYTRSLVDGYAVISEDVAGAYEDRPKELKLVGTVKTGETVLLRIGRGECAGVSTGAVLPYPADAVVPVEYTHARPGVVEIYRSVAKGENVDPAGSDIAEGEVLAWRGDIVTPSLAALLAAVGVSRVHVFRPVRVGVVPTGNELREPGEGLEYGQVYDSNSYLVYGVARMLGADARIYPRAPDVLEEVEEAIHRALGENDIVVTIGGTSAGEEDLVYRVLSSLDPGLIIHGVKQRPGRPLAVAVHGRKLVLGLPGFPLSCLLSINLYLAPLIAKLQGARAHESRYVEAVVPVPMRGDPGSRVFVPCVIVERGGNYTAFPLAGHSGRVSALHLVDGYLVIPESDESLPSGSRARVLVSPFWRPFEANVIGSHDPLLQEVVAGLRSRDRVRLVSTGSLAGLQAVKSGVADVAGTHLLDPETGEYNTPFLKSLGLEGVVLVRGYLREQGFVYREDSVSSFSEVIEKGLKFVNRNAGSGTRALIDHLLKAEAGRLGVGFEELRERLQGYTWEVKTHEAVAYLVARGVADVGVAIRYAAERYGLGFTPIGFERYDLVVRRDSLGKQAVRELLDGFCSEGRRRASETRGYAVDSAMCETLEF
ncbi:MAG: molybdopterin biosynthesis protein [Thermofilum sp.]